MTTVLLWDVDGTLLSTGRAGVFALEDAAREVCGVDAHFQGLATSGLTDAEVAALALRTCGGSDDAATVMRFLDVYERRLPEVLHRREGRVLPGVREILTDLDGRADALSLLLTGNTAGGAAAKLAHYGLDVFFQGAGAFCVGPGTREEIARRALALAAERLGGAPDPERTFVLGDTPFDVRAGHALGVRTIAIATGTHTAADLAAHEPWLVLARLPEPTAFRGLVGVGAR